MRNPWSISYIRKWIEVGKNFVPEKTFIMYTTLMIVGLRAMFRGSELGGILFEDIKSTTHPVRGYRVTARKIKNNPKGRTACIEATDSELCPIKWILKLIQIRDPGPYLFASHFALDTRSISWILRQVAIWINIEGKFSSHSLRIGGATDAAYAKIGKEATKAIGDWSSDAIDRYLRSEFSIDRNVSKDLGF